MVVHTGGLAALLIFYVVILGVGLLAYWKKGRKRDQDEQRADTTTVGRRDIGWLVGGFTMTATWCGGGFINGTAETLFSKGLIYAQPTVGNALALVLSGLFFAKPMREQNYVTMLDPFQIKYGKRIGSLMYIPAFVSEIFWVAAILSALGSSITVVMELEFWICVCISVVFCILYVSIGGIYAVTWTDMGELLLMIFGLILCTPFIWRNPNVHLFQSRQNTTTADNNWTAVSETDWIGTIEPKAVPAYIDNFLLCILGAIPWQDYFQRVLSAKSAQRAQILSYVGALCCILIAIPSAMIGIAARYTDWTAAGYSDKEANEQAFMILPLALEYLSPKVVAFFGVGAVSAAVMSSADASLLSIGSMFTYNVYRSLIRPKASEQELIWTLRLAIISGGIFSAALAIFVGSVTALWYFACDLVYVILFPQLVCVLFLNGTTGAGAVSGSLVGIILRAIAGEPALKWPALVRYPFYDYEKHEQLFPVKTFAMLMNFLVTMVVSYGFERCRHKCDNNRKIGVVSIEPPPIAMTIKSDHDRQVCFY